MEVPELKIQGGAMQDLKPAPPVKDDDGFKGFTKADGSKDDAAALAAA